MAVTSDTLLSFLNDSKLERVYKINVPSMNKEIDFLPLTVKNKKDLGKVSISSNEEDISYYEAILRLIHELSNKQIDYKKITEIEKMYIVNEICANNIMSGIKYEIKCSGCAETFIHTINFSEFSNVLKTIDVKQIINKVYDIGGKEFELTLTLPTVYETYLYKQYIENKVTEIKNTKEFDDDKKQDEIMKLLATVKNYEYNILFVKKMKINGEDVCDYSELDFVKKNNIIDSLPAEIIFGEDGVKEIVLNGFQEQFSKLCYMLNCPSCKKELYNVLNYKNFFLD